MKISCICAECFSVIDADIEIDGNEVTVYVRLCEQCRRQIENESFEEGYAVGFRNGREGLRHIYKGQ
jgi:hypothetical protein